MASIRLKSCFLVGIAAACTLVASPFAAASMAPSFSTTDATATVMAGDMASLDKAALFRARQPVQTALVDSCSDPWYWRSGIEELTCGFTGQGWWN
ncbi:hypothetical protein [Burkholderia plantarii]|uniref:hypothetical protein n=1 Tax=Burkholderia plantarii TaxID=41899 RepID=UPI0018DC6D10|nr:hypothetical protein [Burkholderia plantarii]MBI0330522.1 hypothetical protein [Burkholderia plantarii]